jgi:hypothetical protein
MFQLCLYGSGGQDFKPLHHQLAFYNKAHDKWHICLLAQKIINLQNPKAV